MPYLVINLGGVAIGVAVILVYLIRWWFKEKRQWAALVPFVLAHLYGLLAALATVGAWSILGAATWATLWAANVAGYADFTLLNMVLQAQGKPQVQAAGLDKK